MSKNNFESIFRINNKPILPPLITEDLKNEIIEIRNICKMKEEKIKQRKDSINYSKKAEDESCSSAHSYTISNPVFPVSKLPVVTNDNKFDSDKDTIDDEGSIQSELNDDDDKNILRDTKTTNGYEHLQQPDLKNQMKSLIHKQKEEYLRAMDVLKRKFIIEQQQLFAKIQDNVQNHTSTPLTNNSFALTEDDEFTEFQTCLQSSTDKTLLSEMNIKVAAVTKINAFVRGYLTRRLMKTIYVQEIMKSIQETLNFVLTLSQHKFKGSPVNDIILKTKLFKQLRSDLYRYNAVFHHYTPKERMKIISGDRDIRKKKIAEKNLEFLNSSFTQSKQ